MYFTRQLVTRVEARYQSNGWHKVLVRASSFSNLGGPRQEQTGKSKPQVQSVTQAAFCCLIWTYTASVGRAGLATWVADFFAVSLVCLVLLNLMLFAEPVVWTFLFAPLPSPFSDLLAWLSDYIHLRLDQSQLGCGSLPKCQVLYSRPRSGASHLMIFSRSLSYHWSGTATDEMLGPVQWCRGRTAHLLNMRS